MRRLLLVFTAVVAICTVAPLHAGLFGLPKFKVEQSDDRFSTDGLTTYSGMFNRISKKSLAGGVHIDGLGVFVEPFAIKRKADNQLVSLGFFIHNEASYDTAYGSPLTLGVPQRITFLTGEGEPMALEIRKGDSKWGEIASYNSITKSTSAKITETGYSDLTPEQYLRIVNATALAVKIEGDKRSMVYEVKDVAKTFIPNLKSFYDAHVAK